ncbi:hypothetical protein C3L33_14733, partial [Rhododendron williamsianum]
MVLKLVVLLVVKKAQVVAVKLEATLGNSTCGAQLAQSTMGMNYHWHKESTSASAFLSGGSKNFSYNGGNKGQRKLTGNQIKSNPVG